MKIDYNIKSQQERTNLVNQIVNSTPSEQLTPKYIAALTKYIFDGMSDREQKYKRSKEIITDNRLLTINKNETSYEGLCGKLENGEDGIYNMMSNLGKSERLTLKDPITQKDIDTIPELKALIDSIAVVEDACKKATGKRKYLLKKQIIEMRKDQYTIRQIYRGGLKIRGNVARTIARLDLYDSISFDDAGNPVNAGPISFFNPAHIQALLCNYSGLKEEAYGKFEYDLYYLMEDLDDLIDSTLKQEYPLYYDLLIYKIDGKTNAEIQSLLEENHGIKHSIEYISSLWRNKIPKLIADKAQKDYLVWYYTNKEYGQWKKCSRCGEVKLAHNKFFSKNNSSKDGWYSLCKCCRNAGTKKKLKQTAAKEKYLDKKDS